MDQRGYLRSVPKMFEFVRKTCGEDVELLHDIHERVEPMDAINLIKQLEQYIQPASLFCIDIYRFS